MRTLLTAAVTLVLAAAPALTQPIPPQQKDNDASVGGAVRTRPAPNPPAATERGDDKLDTFGRTAPPTGPSDTTTGSALPGGAAVESEVDATVGTMDDDESEASRKREPRLERR
jgi:hypothetical protein